jgi:branched-subunit amino acid transport protein
MRAEYLILFLFMGVVTYLTRAPFLVFSGRINLPKAVSRSLKYIPAAILSTLIFPGIFIPNGEMAFTLSSPYIWAAATTVVVVLFSKNSLAGIVSGMVCMVVLRQLF